MTSKRNRPNYSMYLPPKLRKEIDQQIESGRYSSVAGFLVESAEQHLNVLKSLKS